jgi:cytoskeleton protein RodZ
MSSAPFGEHLRREREMRGVSLEEISAATRISTRFLEALENDQWDQLPGGVFNRGFIRSIARFLGLDEDDLVAEYAVETKGRVEAGVVPDPPMAVPRRYGPAILALALLVALVGGISIGYKVFGARIAAHLRDRHFTATANAGSPPPSAKTTAAASDPSAASAAASPSGDPTTVPALAATPLQLKIEVGKPADLKVTSDGRVLFDGHVDAASSALRFEANDTFEISSTDSSAVLLELNGQTVAPLGLPGQPGSVKLTHSDLKPAAGAAH